MSGNQIAFDLALPPRRYIRRQRAADDQVYAAVCRLRRGGHEVHRVSDAQHCVDGALLTTAELIRKAQGA
ncbi:hypothetical protein [Zavarzinia aquatilis]|uniref:Uncharacterized protein n=1 Tax=Zavarzinia aquatilis TaxID=2211142 RepID=A0A317DSM6_9PROT|nr:hypothetical protein [Zavarzinia aquatilis]PWR17661.1 hypothetical protein DKG74_20860 [Zavarzinia aquatilis]